MFGFTLRANVFLVVIQPRRFVAQNGKEIEGLGCLLGICPEFVRNSEFARSSLGKRPGPAMRGTLQPKDRVLGQDILEISGTHGRISLVKGYTLSW